MMALKLRLTDDEHDQLNRFRNHVNLWVGYGIIVLLGASGLAVFVGLAVRAWGRLPW